MQPIPRLNEKKACPRAASIVSPVIFEKSGYKRNLTPSLAPSRVRDLIASNKTRINSIGISILEYFSIPFFTPATTIRADSVRNKRCIATGIKEDCEKPENWFARDVLSDVRKSGENDLKMYSKVQPPTTL